MSAKNIVTELDQGQAALDVMLERAGLRREAGDLELLLSYSADVGVEDAPHLRFQVIVDSAVHGFFHLAAEGHAFVSIVAYREEFGGSLDSNYPGAGLAFQRLATSYWTLYMLQGRVSVRYGGTLLQQALSAVQTRIGAAFFPDDPGGLDSAQRARVQRNLIAQSGAPIDFEEFLIGNPLLVGNPLADA